MRKGNRAASCAVVTKRVGPNIWEGKQVREHVFARKEAETPPFYWSVSHCASASPLLCITLYSYLYVHFPEPLSLLKVEAAGNFPHHTPRHHIFVLYYLISNHEIRKVRFNRPSHMRDECRFCCLWPFVPKTDRLCRPSTHMSFNGYFKTKYLVKFITKFEK
jgi:hypothetical protein